MCFFTIQSRRKRIYIYIGESNYKIYYWWKNKQYEYIEIIKWLLVKLLENLI